MAEGDASGEAAVKTSDAVDAPVEEDVAPSLPEDEPGPDPDGRTFDAFNATTWTFEPAPPPWHRTPQSVVALVAVSIAVIALVVSGVLLAFRGPTGTEDGDGGPAPTTSPPTTATTTPGTSAALLPPPPPPPPPVPPPPASPPAPSQVQRAPTTASPTKPSKRPTLNMTRSPISASPQMPGRPGN